MTPKPVTKTAPKVQPFMLPDAMEHYGSPLAQAEMDAFLNSLTQEQKVGIMSMQKVMQSGACYKCGYKKVLRFVFAWFQNHGMPITVQL
jgi:hypothetical protein